MKYFHERKQFSERELALVELLADLSDRRTKEEKAQAVGYHKKHVYRLQHRPDFREAVHKRALEVLGINLVAVFGMLFDKALDGDLKAAELLLKASGHIQTGASVVTNVRQDAGGTDNREFKERLAEEERAAEAGKISLERIRQDKRKGR